MNQPVEKLAFLLGRIKTASNSAEQITRLSDLIETAELWQRRLIEAMAAEATQKTAYPQRKAG